MWQYFGDPKYIWFKRVCKKACTPANNPEQCILFFHATQYLGDTKQKPQNMVCKSFFFFNVMLSGKEYNITLKLQLYSSIAENGKNHAY